MQDELYKLYTEALTTKSADKVKKVLDIDPQDEEMIIGYARLLTKENRYAEAEEWLKKVVKTNRVNQATLMRAKVLFLQKRFSESKMLYESLLESNMKNKAIAELTKFEINEMNDIKYSRSLSNAEKEIKLKMIKQKIRGMFTEAIVDCKNFEVYLNYANFEFFENNLDRARELYMLAKKYAKNHYFIKYRLACICVIEKKYAEARELLNELTKDKYNNLGGVYLELGKIELAENNYQVALSNFKKSLEYNNSPYALMEYGKVCVKLGLYEDAEKSFRELLNSRYQNQAMYELGKMFQQTGKDDEAKKMFETLLKGNSLDRSLANIALGKMASDARNYELAKEYFFKVLDGSIKDKAVALIELSKICVSNNMVAEGEKYLKDALALNLGDHGKLEMAKVYVIKGKNEAAKKIYKELILSNSKDKDLAALELGKTYINEKKYDKAKEVIKPLLNSTAMLKNRAMITLAKIAEFERRYEDASSLYETVLKNCTNFDRTIVKYEQGKIAYQRGEFGKAKGLFKEILGTSKEKNALYQIFLIDITTNTNYEEVKKDIEDTTRRNPAFAPFANYLLGIIAMKENNLKEARKYFLENVKQTTILTSLSLIKLGSLETDLNNIDSANNYYKQVFESNGRYMSEAIFSMAKNYMEINKYDEAEKWFRYLIDENFCNSDSAKLAIGKIRFKQSKFDEAHEIFTDLLGTDGKVFALLELGRIEVERQNYEAAANYYQQLMNSSNRNYALLEFGRLELKRGNYEKAEKYLEELYTIGSFYDKECCLFELARAKMLLGKNSEARSCYEKLLNSSAASRVITEMENISDDFDEEDGRDSFIKLINSDIHDKSSVLYEFARFEKQHGNIQKAMEYFSQVESEKLRPYAVLELGNYSLANNDIERAQYYYSQALNTFIHGIALVKLGNIEELQNNHSQAAKYYNEALTTQSKWSAYYALGLSKQNNGDVEDAKKIFSEIIASKPSEKDASQMIDAAKISLAKIYIIEKRLDEARKLLEEIEDPKYSACKNTELLFLDIHEKKYKDALYRALKKMRLDSGDVATTALIFLCKKLNVTVPTWMYGSLDNYSTRQVIDYDENSAIDHTYEHTTDLNFKEKHTKFREGIDVSLLFDSISSLLTPETFLKNSMFDEYIIPFENVGTQNENFIKVVTLPNSKEVISMYPIHNENKFFRKI